MEQAEVRATDYADQALGFVISANVQFAGRTHFAVLGGSTASVGTSGAVGCSIGRSLRSLLSLLL
jgi:hypothetical protein